MDWIVWDETDSPWQKFFGELDLELFLAGTGEGITRWGGHDFSGDPYWRLYMALCGEFRLCYSDREYPVRPGTVCLVPARRPFRFRGVEPSTHHFIHFMSDKLRQLPAFREFQELPTARFELPEELFRQAKKLLEPPQKIAAAIDSKLLLLKLLRPFLDSLAEEEYYPEEEEFSRILDYIDLKLDCDLEISELAGLTRLSRAEFSAAFRRRFGIPPKQYISSRRIGHAKLLLLRTKLNNREIALRCGYKNEFFFYRIFRRYTGMAPGDYRRRNRFE